MSERALLGLLLLSLASAAAGQPSGLADPLRPEILAPQAGEAAMGEPSQPRLSMIVRNQRRQFAVIDGIPRRVGERWDGWRLLAIRPSSVLLEQDGGQTVELGLLSAAIIKKNHTP